MAKIKGKTEKEPSQKIWEEMNKKLKAIESLLILQLIQNGVEAKQIEKVLQVEKIASTNIPKSFPVNELKKKNGKTKK